MNDYGTRQKVGLFLGPILFFLILLLPTPEGMSPEALKVGAVTVLMAVWWISEAIPIPATALLPIALFPVLGIMKSAAVTAPYADHLIYLFMGGFLIAVTMEKWNLHKRIALSIINFVGVGPERIVLGFMVATAFLSMWISNTATAMMMVPIGLAVINQAVSIIREQGMTGVDTTPQKFNFGAALMLGIAYAASIGGVATIIGTPPNTVVVGVVEKVYGQQISFAQWMAFGVPLAAVMLIASWAYLVKVALPIELKELPGGRAFIKEEMRKLGSISREEIMVLSVFILVAVSWIARGFVGDYLINAGLFTKESYGMISDTTIGMIGAFLLFIIPTNLKKGEFLLDWETAVKIPWGIIVLFGGGLALAEGFGATGLAAWMAEQLTVLDGASVVTLIFAVTLFTIFLTEVTSNTATATMLMPIMGSMALAMAVHPYGLMVAAGIAASFAFMLPVATPPNAVVFGSGYVTIPQMAKAGFWLNVIGVVLITAFVIYLLPVLWGVDLSVLPEWAANANLETGK